MISRSIDRSTDRLIDRLINRSINGSSHEHDHRKQVEEHPGKAFKNLELQLTFEQRVYLSKGVPGQIKILPPQNINICRADAATAGADGAAAAAAASAPASSVARDVTTAGAVQQKQEQKQQHLDKTRGDLTKFL